MRTFPKAGQNKKMKNADRIITQEKKVRFFDFQFYLRFEEIAKKAAAKFPEKNPKQYDLTEEECDYAQGRFLRFFVAFY